MTSRLDLDLPPAGHSLPVDDLERFVEHACHAGAGTDTVAIAVTSDHDPDMTIALRAAFDRLAAGRTEPDDLLELFAEIEHSDGDANVRRRAIRSLRQRLTEHAK